MMKGIIKTPGISAYELTAHVMRLIRNEPLTAKEIAARMFIQGVIPSERTIHRIINDIERAGWRIEVSQRRTGSARTPNIYYLP